MRGNGDITFGGCIRWVVLTDNNGVHIHDVHLLSVRLARLGLTTIIVLDRRDSLLTVSSALSVAYEIDCMVVGV